jgi:hypothetical protein
MSKPAHNAIASVPYPSMPANGTIPMSATAKIACAMPVSDTPMQERQLETHSRSLVGIVQRPRDGVREEQHIQP